MPVPLQSTLSTEGPLGGQERTPRKGCRGCGQGAVRQGLPLAKGIFGGVTSPAGAALPGVGTYPGHFGASSSPELPNPLGKGMGWGGRSAPMLGLEQSPALPVPPRPSTAMVGPPAGGTPLLPLHGPSQGSAARHGVAQLLALGAGGFPAGGGLAGVLQGWLRPRVVFAGTGAAVTSAPSLGTLSSPRPVLQGGFSGGGTEPQPLWGPKEKKEGT